MKTLMLLAAALLLAGCAPVFTGPDWARASVPARTMYVPLAVTQPAGGGLTLEWRNENTGSPDVVTGIVSTTNLAAPMSEWVVRWATNCDVATNTLTLPRDKPQEYFRAYNL